MGPLLLWCLASPSLPQNAKCGLMCSRDRMSGKQKRYSQEQLAQALSDLERGESIRPVSQRYNIPKSTLSDKKLNKYEGKPHPNRAISQGEEEALVGYILWMAEHGSPLTRTTIKCLALEMVKEGHPQTLVNLQKGLSDNWWSRFKARHPELRSRTPDSLDRARAIAATPEAISRFFDLYEKTITTHSLQDKPHLIWNCDETGFGDKPKSREKVVCQKGRRHVYRQQTTTREHITVHLAVSAAGGHVPPFIIYPRCFPSVAYALDGPPHSLYGSSEKGYMTSELFQKWLVHFLKHAPEERPLVLIMDQHETHCGRKIIDFCRANQVEILLLPPHTTHMLQPLDVSVFNPLKATFSTLASRMGLIRGDMVVGKTQFSSVLKHAHLKAASSANIQAGFRKAGLYPVSSMAPAAGPSSTPAAAGPSSTPAAAGPSSTPAAAGLSSTPAAGPSSASASSSPTAPEPSCSPTSSSTPGCSDVCPTFGSKAPRRRVPQQARVITSDEYVAQLDRLEAEEKEKELQKRKRKEEQEKRKLEKRARQERATNQNPAAGDGGCCATCRQVAPPGPDAAFDEWVQCEFCELWFHLGCANLDEVPDGEWLCHKCRVTV